MKSKKRRAQVLRLKIEELDEQISRALQNNKPAFAKRLSLIKEKLEEKLLRWTFYDD